MYWPRLMVGLRKQERCLALHKHRTYILGLLLLYFLLLLVLLFEQLLLQRYIVGWESHGFYSTGRAHFFKHFFFFGTLPSHARTNPKFFLSSLCCFFFFPWQILQFYSYYYTHRKGLTQLQRARMPTLGSALHKSWQMTNRMGEY